MAKREISGRSAIGPAIVAAWCDEIRDAEVAGSNREIAELLGVTERQLYRMQNGGATKTMALAMSAVKRGLPPYKLGR